MAKKKCSGKSKSCGKKCEKKNCEPKTSCTKKCDNLKANIPCTEKPVPQSRPPEIRKSKTDYFYGLIKKVFGYE